MYDVAYFDADGLPCVSGPYGAEEEARAVMVAHYDLGDTVAAMTHLDGTELFHPQRWPEWLEACARLRRERFGSGAFAL